jgi:hypothetical protein
MPTPNASARRHPTTGWRLGRGPGVKRGTKDLRVTKYIVDARKLPPAPPRVVHSANVQLPLGMMGNDVWGDCVVAGAGHLRQSWTANSGRGQSRPSDAAVLAKYHKMSPNDTGLWPVDFLNDWRVNGLDGDQIEAWAQVDAGNVGQAELCVQLFGGTFTGLSLPGVNTYGPWTTVTGPPDPQNGHLVAIVDYDRPRRMFLCATWGQWMEMSYDFYYAYCDEGQVAFDDIMLRTDGLSPEGFDTAGLLDDLLHIDDPIIPVVPPEPGPPPAPDPAWCITPKSWHFARSLFRR